MLKKIIVLVAIVAIAGPLAAQPNLGDATIPTPSKSFTYIQALTEGVDPGPGGVDVVWDFSGLVQDPALPDLVRVNYLMPSQMPSELQAAFPTADRAVQIDTVIDVYQKTDTTLRWLGAQSPSASAMASTTDPYDTRPIEIVFNQPTTDTYTGSLTVDVGPVTFERAGFSQVIYDGFGEVILPGGVKYGNVARVFENTTVTDSTQLGPDIFVVKTRVGKISYQNASNDSVYVVITSVTITSTRNGIEEQPPVNIETVRYIFDDNASGVNEEDLSNSLSVYPNPTLGSSIVVQGIESMPSSIYIIDGKGQRASAVAFTSEGNGSIRITLPALSSGVHLVEINRHCGKAGCAPLTIPFVLQR